MARRDKLIREFHDNGNDIRVLIFSTVGSAGLNLSVADVVIFFVSASNVASCKFLSCSCQPCRISLGLLRTKGKYEDEPIVNPRQR